MVLLTFLIFLLCLALPMGEVTRVTIGLVVSFTLVDIIVVVGSLVWLGRQFFLKKQPVSFQAKMFVIVSGLFTLSLLFNITRLTQWQFIASALYIVRWVVLGMLFFMVKESSSVTKHKIQSVLFVSGGLLVLSGYVQYFFYPSLRNLIYFGWDEHFYRMFGTFFDPNFFGLFLVLFFILILSKLFRLSVHKEKITFAALFLLGNATFFAIFLSYSRTALVAFIFGLIILFWNKHFWKWLWTILVAAVVTGFFVYMLSVRTTDVNSLFRTTSAGARIGSAKNALIIFQDNPVTGVGFNAYRYSMYKHHFMSGSSIQEDHGASGVDSSLLLVLATSGVIGLTAFLVFLWSHVRALLANKNRLGLATFVAFFVGSFFVNGLFYPFLLVWVWVVLGITEASLEEV